jgi:cytochrome P450
VIDLTDLDNFAYGFPHDLFAELRRERSVFFHEPTERTPGGEGFCVITRHADVLAAAAHATALSSHCGGEHASGGTLIEDLPDGLVAGVLLNMMDDPRHNRIRRLALPCVTPKALAQLEADLTRRANSIVEAAVDKGTCDFLVEVAAELPLQAIAGLMGIPQGDRHELFAWAEAMLDYDDRQLGESTEATAAANAAMFDYGRRLLDGKRDDDNEPGDILAAVMQHDVTTELEQQMFFSLLVAAGTETTRNSIAVGLLAFLTTGTSGSSSTTIEALSPRPSRRSCDGRRRPRTTVAPPPERSMSTSTRSRPATRSRCGGRQRTATSTYSGIRSGSTCAAIPIPTSHSATARTSVSARTWRDSRSG